MEESGWNLVGKISRNARYMIDITGMDSEKIEKIRYF